MKKKLTILLLFTLVSPFLFAQKQTNKSTIVVRKPLGKNNSVIPVVGSNTNIAQEIEISQYTKDEWTAKKHKKYKGKLLFNRIVLNGKGDTALFYYPKNKTQEIGIIKFTNKKLVDTFDIKENGYRGEKYDGRFFISNPTFELIQGYFTLKSIRYPSAGLNKHKKVLVLYLSTKKTKKIVFVSII